MAKLSFDVREVSEHDLLDIMDEFDENTDDMKMLPQNVLFRYTSYYHPVVIFHELFKCISNQLQLAHNVDANKIGTAFVKRYGKEIKRLWKMEKHGYKEGSLNKRLRNAEFIFLLKSDILVFFDSSDAIIYFNPGKNGEKYAREVLDSLYELAQPFKKVVDNTIYLLINSGSGLDLACVDLNPFNVNVETHYNDDLPHASIVATLKENQAGLLLFYGEPGTGKSTYIEHIVCAAQKTVVMLSPKIANSLDDPNLIGILVQYPNSIIVIEDAEQLLGARDSGMSSSGISLLLGITDGLLKSLNIQVIATFNTSLLNIDKAVLRRGRCRMLYEFKPLTVEKARALSAELGQDPVTIDRPTALADIYYHSDTFSNAVNDRSKNAIGFRK